MSSDTTNKLRLTLVRSLNGRLAQHKNNVRGLGLRKMHQTVEVQATPENLGMVKASAFMLKVEEI